MLKTFKYRLYPNKQQQRLLEHQLEECRWLYNHLLAQRREAGQQRHHSLRCYDQAARLPALKAERAFAGGVQSWVLQNVAGRIDLAFQASSAACETAKNNRAIPVFVGEDAT